MADKKVPHALNVEEVKAPDTGSFKVESGDTRTGDRVEGPLAGTLVSNPMNK